MARKHPMRQQFTESAALLKRLREELHLSKNAFARIIGMDGATYRRYENGEHSMTIDRLVGVSKQFGHKLDYVPDPTSLLS